MSRPKQPKPASDASPRKHVLPRGTLSKVAGAGAGSGLIVWAEALNLSQLPRMILLASAPWLAVCLATVGPYVSRFLINTAKYYGLMHSLGRAKKLLASVPPDAPNRASVESNVRELETMISDLIKDSATLWT
jgi:hypothetical protein